MADVEFGYDGENRITEDVLTAGLINWLGALMSIGLVVGLGVWGFNLTARDAGSVPVIAALEGPMRVQPDDPGGERAAHQGLAVNEIQAEGTAAAPADRIVLAPQPVDLFAQAPMSAVVEAPEATAPIVEEQVLAAPTISEPTQLVSATPNEEVVQDPIAAALALAEKLAAGAQKFEETQAATTATEEIAEADTTPAVVETKVIAKSIPGVSKSLRPVARPAGDLKATAVARNATAASPSNIDLDPSKIVAGMRLVQLGAFGSPEIAKSEWTKRVSEFGEYIGDKKRVIQRTETGGRVFYRLRVAGFEGLSDARRFCTVLLAENAACIPVVAR